MTRGTRRRAALAALFLAAGGAFGLLRAPSAGAAALESAAAETRVADVFSTVPQPWTAAIGHFLPAGTGLAPVAVTLQSAGYSVGIDPANRRPVLMRGARILPVEDAAGAARMARRDARPLVDRTARDLLERSQSEGLKRSERLDVEGKLRLLSEDASLSAYLSPRRAAAIQDAERRIVAALGRPEEDGAAGPEPVSGGERFHSNGLLRSVLDKLRPEERRKARDAAAWAEYSEKYREAATRDMNAKRSRYLRARAENDAYMVFLEKAGARFASDDIRVPDLKTVLGYYNGEMGKLAAAGVVDARDVLKPARMFLDKDSNVFPLEFGKPIPDGARAYPYRVLDSPDFRKTIALGYFPIGEPIEDSGAGWTHPMTEHDLAHLAAFLDDPAYMTALKRTIGSSRLPKGDLEENRQSRMTVSTEFLNGLPSRNASLFVALLPARTRELVRSDDAGRVRRELMKMKAPELAALRRSLDAAYPRLMRHSGGSSNDLAIRQVAHGRTEVTLVYFLRRRMMSASPLDRPRLADALARFIVGAYQSSRLGPDDWFRAALATKVSSRSRVYKYVCGYGVWDPSSDLYRAYCVP